MVCEGSEVRIILVCPKARSLDSDRNQLSLSSFDDFGSKSSIPNPYAMSLGFSNCGRTVSVRPLQSIRKKTPFSNQVHACTPLSVNV
jgi:hypothetical protein